MRRVTIEPWEYEHACNVGIQRFTRNWLRNDAAHYDRSKMEDDRTAQVASALCELAVAKVSNRYWHAHVWDRRDHNIYRNLPDVGSNIEVRRCRTRDAVAVRRTDAGKVIFAARVVGDEFREVDVIGYGKADDLIPMLDAGQDWGYIGFEFLTILE